MFNLLHTIKRIGVPIIAITANLDSVLAKQSGVVLSIGIKEEACPHDLAPTSSTTAMLVMGDALAIALLEKRQFTKEDFAFLHPAGTLGKRLLLRVEDIMEKRNQIASVPLTATMKDAVLKMAAKRGICSVIDENEKIAGVLTTGDLNRLVEKTEHFFQIPVREVMNPNPKICYSDTMAYTIYKKMEQYRIIAMPVVDHQEKLVGVIHLHDIMRSGVF